MIGFSDQFSDYHDIKTREWELTGKACKFGVPLYFDDVICNAKHIKNLGEKKTDYVDAHWIQVLHTYGLLIESFLPGNNITGGIQPSRNNLIDWNGQGGSPAPNCQ